MKFKKLNIGSKFFGNRTIIGIICIAVSLVICFGAAPLLNKAADVKSEVVRVRQTVVRGNKITEEDIEIVKVGSHNLPKNCIRKRDDIIGKFAVSDLYEGDYIFPAKLTEDSENAEDILGGLEGDKKVISVSIGSFAQGLSGKLETGDIVSVIVYSSKEGTAFTPPELQYLKVITSTASTGEDKPKISTNAQPVTVTLLANKKQAELLALYERSATMHFTLEYRGDIDTAKFYLEMQDNYFEGGGK